MASTDSRHSAPAALLLLPPPPAVSLDQVKKVFETPISEALEKLARSVNGPDGIATLDLALELPGLLDPANRPRAKIFAQLQHYLTSIYTLIGAVAAVHEIELDEPGGIDARVLFIDRSLPAPQFPQWEFGPILSLQSLATSGRRWDHVFYLENHSGQTLSRAFFQLLNDASSPTQHPTLNVQAITASSNWTVPQHLLFSEDQPSLPFQPHYSVIVGGTFDHLHLGHKLLLTALALTLEPPTEANEDQNRLLSVGVTGDQLLVNKKYAEFLESWEERFQNTAAFLTAIMDFSPPEAQNQPPRLERTTAPGPNGNFVVMRIQPRLAFKFVEIWDPYGPTITEERLTALVVSKETSAGGAAVNVERAKKGWKGLAIFEVDVLQTGDVTEATANNFESKISSTDIRRRRMHLAKV
ncbi:hypothetical protein N7462_008431 [Penicillium macrosclerotiorum]|uniref:uncharacterized protein n=1 Tax=Penicillium macrosclerotiorum TaxID=303699 RepID=UPI002546CE41|nr:uncharacterized protein N7462_008431 [Penicillium macrosclerotiorum]KAJ5675534.1 hypothetical protein N7462_008431 [Penicillium macrosclerotiorum]